MRFRHLPLLFSSLTLLFPWSAFAQSLTISGTVADTQAVPIAEATVTLTTGSAAGRRIASTDASGKYAFTGLTGGSYQVVVDHAGYEAATRAGTFDANLDLAVTLQVAGVVTSIDVTDVAGKATASRMDIPDRDLPQMVSVIPQALLQQQAVNNMVDALKNASGVQAFRWYGAYEYYTVRGFNGDDVTLFLADGMRLEGNRFNTQLNNVETVEVLKGPTSVLYGGGALGGVINVVRKKPQGTRAYDLMYRGGRFNSHQVAGGATGPVGNLQRLLYRVDASYDYSDGWRKAGAKRINASPSLTWLINDRSRVTVHQTFTRDRFAGDGGVDINLTTLPNYDPTWRFSLPQDRVLVEDSQTQILFNTNLSKTWEFRDGFLLRRTSDKYFVTEGIYGSPSENLVYREPLDFHHTRRPIQNQADLIGRLNFLGMHHTVMTGYEYRDFYTRTDVTAGDDPDCTCGYWYLTIPPMDLTTLQETAPKLDIDTIYRSTYQANRIHGVYWQDQIDVLPNLKINVAGRYDDYNRQVHRTFASDPDTRVGIQTRNQDAYTYRAGIVYTPKGAHQFYFNTATSFTPVTVIPANLQELRPQKGLTYEVGHRWQGLNGRANTNIALYHIERDGQTIAINPISVTQVGLQKSKGVDVDLNLALGMGTTLRTNYGFTQGIIEDPGRALDGKTPRYIPKHLASAWLHKEWRKGWNTSLGTRYVGPQFATNNNGVRIGGFTTLSGAVGLRRDRWEWSLNADNLFNRQRYFLPGHFDNNVFPGAPINVSSTIRFRFN